jgi:hypothetical protein
MRLVFEHDTQSTVVVGKLLAPTIDLNRWHPSGMTLALRALLPVMRGFAIGKINDFFKDFPAVSASKIMQSETLVVRNVSRAIRPAIALGHRQAIPGRISALQTNN